MKGDFVFSSESVTEGHPDKLCDQIGDAIVDRFLERDPHARIIAESAVAKSIVFIAARFASTAQVDIPEAARTVIRQVGYDRGEFNAEDCTVLTSFLELGSDVYVQRDERELDDEALERRSGSRTGWPDAFRPRAWSAVSRTSRPTARPR